MKRLSKLVGADSRRILERIPYVGLDIESVSADHGEPKTVRVEYSPNRPDFGSDLGIARALRAQLGIEVGLRRYEVRPSGWGVKVDPRLSNVRPFIACALVEGLKMDDEDVRQLISLQEDLHNGIGRRRKKVSIGLHDSAPLEPPISYWGAPSSFAFVPLDGSSKMTLGEILAKTQTGRSYGHILRGAPHLPMLSDSAGTVLSFPPIINGNKTKVTKRSTSIFVDVTSTEERIGDDALAIITTTLADMGGSIGSVTVSGRDGRRTTPDLQPRSIALDPDLVNQITGLGLKRKEMVECLRKSGLDAEGKRALYPRYRTDILHPVDVAEEVALGYGVDRIKAEYPPSKQPGVFNAFEQFLDRVAGTMAGMGMSELMTYELLDEKTLYRNFGRPSTRQIEVEGPRSLEHSILRDSLIPSLMASLAYNVKEEYPQRLFEIGRVYRRSGSGAAEEWHLGCLVAHAQASYSEAKMYLESLCRIYTGRQSSTKPAAHWAFAVGRTASVSLGGKPVGDVGEVKPECLASFGLGVPVSGFEIDLSALSKHLK